MSQNTMAESFTDKDPGNWSSSSSSPVVAAAASEPQPEPEPEASLPKLSPKVRCAQLSDCSAQLMNQNHTNFKRSGDPVRIMSYREGSWEDFQAQEFEYLRCGFVECKPVTEVVIEGTEYAFDFLRMVQIDLGSGKRRSIAWIDEKGKPFFPKMFLDDDSADEEENSRFLKIDIDVRVDGNGDGAKRKSGHLGVNGKDAEVTSSMKNIKQAGEVSGSKRQRLASTGFETSKWPNAKFVSQNERTFSFVSDLFLLKINKIDPGATVTAIHEFKLLGSFEKVRWEVFQRQIEITKAARGASNIVYAWYAATAEAAGSILSRGFGLPSKTPGVMPACGVGIYLSPVELPHLSAMLSEADNNGEKHIILCRVILGNVEKVKIGSQQTCPSSANFDTGTDDPKNPMWYVVWSTNKNTHILPECVVSCKTSLVPGQLSSFNCKRQPLSKLFSGMKKRLPSSKLQEVVTLHETYKAGKLDKEMFTKQLRVITGEEVLMSIIQEIQSSG